MSVDWRNPLIFWPTAFGILLIWTHISKCFEAWKERRSLRRGRRKQKGMGLVGREDGVCPCTKKESHRRFRRRLINASRTTPTDPGSRHAKPPS
jgi:hypothetical protein